MKLGIMSDTHDRIECLRLAMSEFEKRGVKTILHCGDFIAPFMLKILRQYPVEELIGVFGNNDGEVLGMHRLAEGLGRVLKAPAFVEVAGRRVAVLHEPMPDDVMAALPVDIVAFGHTHEIVIRPGKPLVINPGECCGLLYGRPTVATVDLDTLEPELIDLG